MPNLIWSLRYDSANTGYNIGNTSNASSNIESHPPTLAPANQASGYFESNSLRPTTTNVNVVNDFYWTYSPLGASRRKEVPKIILTEKRLKTNAMIAQIIASFNAAKQGASNVIQELKSTSIGAQFSSFIETLEKLAVDTASNVTNAAGTYAPEITQSIQNAATNAAAQARQGLNDLANRTTDQNPIMNTDLLKAYKDLYPTVDTGWRYIFPYFDDYYSSSQNIFGDDAIGNLLNVGIAASETLTNLAAAAGALQRPFGFSFQERAKFYNFPTEGEEVTFSFPLINTGSASFDDVIRNWQLLFMLLYQNKPARLNRTIIEPPVIYQVEIPGQKFYPFCYVSNIAVDFKGARREMSFQIPFQNRVYNDTGGVEIVNNEQISIVDEQIETKNKVFTTIIPDAYMVKITLKSLLAETRNFMVYSLQAGQGGNTLTRIVNQDENIQNLNSQLLGNSYSLPGAEFNGPTFPTYTNTNFTTNTNTPQ
jgi:hypothetical protein